MAYEKGYVATLAEMEAWYADEPAGAVLELMNQTNDILSDVQWLESNQTDGHKTRIRTGLPEVYWRRIYRGTPPVRANGQSSRNNAECSKPVWNSISPKLRCTETEPKTSV